ncbi:phage tail tape measure protein [Xenorhabdus anantnagensis]|uniref:Phage tail tape measure protein n=1 Tax=Xenorhabdus anantnagensis TaxID=3025875 RepID=A0ABT5LYR4_9GAMM|nr:phage tail tape measure protein [Xenorhabdus anantnagensis]MDC9598893.1 phage tail tape measure protein [Xenorhabdus anantnagensis]
MARVMAGSGITRSEMAASIANVVGTGLFSDNEIARVAKAAAQMNYITGQAVDTTINQFKRLQDEPLQMSLELEKANHHLTAAQLEQIRTLELQGNTTAAARVAIDAYAQSINDGANDIDQNLGYLESAWVGVQNAAKGAWDTMLNVGRKSTLDDTIREWEEKLIEFQTNPASKGIFYYRTGISVDDIKNELETLKEKKFQVDIKNAREQAKKNAEQIAIQKFRTQQKWHNSYASPETKRNEKLAKLEAEKYALTQEQYEEYKKQINYKHRDRKMPGTGKKPTKEPKFKVDAGTRVDEAASQALLSLQAQLRVLKEHKTVNDVISSERKKLWDMESKIAILEEAQGKRKLTEGEKSLLLQKDTILESQRALAIVGDEVELQKQKNRELDQQKKRIDEINARTRALIDSAGKSDRVYQQEIALGKAKTPEEKDALTKHFEEEEALRGNWEKGIQKGFAEFQDQATNTYANVAQISQAAFAGMSNSLSDFLLTGKANFGDFTKSILGMIAKMLMQMAILQAMKAAFGGQTEGWRGAVAGVLGYSSGGYTGSGNKYDIAGYVHKDEFVFDKESTQRLGVANLYRLMDGAKKGYASGGHVGGSQSMIVSTPTPRMYGMQPAPAGGDLYKIIRAVNGRR